MIRVEYRDLRVDVPSSWGDITLREYESINFSEYKTRRDKVDLIARLCKKESSDMLTLPVDVFNRIAGIVSFLFDANLGEPCTSIEIEGITYTLNTEDRLTLGEWVDVEEVQKGGDNVMSNVLAIVCRPVGEEYDCARNEERAELFGALPVSKTLGVLAFFLHSALMLSRRSALFSTLRETEKLLPQITGLSQNRGGGIRLSTIWRGVKFGITVRLLRYRLRKYLRTYNIGEIKNAQKGRNDD